MRKLAIFLIFANLVHLWLVLPIGDLLDGRSMVVYPFVIPHIWALLTVLVLLAVIAINPKASIAIVITICALFATLATAIFAMPRWSGGEHGAATFWFLFVGGFSLVNVGAALVLLYLLGTKRREPSVKLKSHRSTDSRPP